ncbi:COG2426 family protein [Caminicella sporogenes]|uniref:COG2426 family protein n=1 Tax=Caminicella sporogenes TaxID=166485 RepID=UPI0025420596|nr:small multi-drug export protein [Caminicella sporogenes]WIF96118.1 small multi-drug export protein [Caminicella sporogenes]
MDILEAFSREIKVFFLSMLPVIELRGAIPYAVSMGMIPIHAALVCLAGSMIPVPFILFFLRPFFSKMRRHKLIRKFEDWLINRTIKRAKNVKKYEALGLMLFVAVPLPSTGVWTGAMAAAFLNMRIKHAFFAIFVGNTIAAFIITFLSHIAAVKM